MSSVRVLPLRVQEYSSNRLHGSDMPWQETNCYVDVLIEVIHSLGAEVEPCLAFTLASDWELDQWTFFKPPLADLNSLYDIEVQELNLWRNLEDHCFTQVGGGRLPLLEVDSFYLPDTHDTDYRRNHTKTTIAINEIDRTNRCLGYFHNSGYHRLAGEDYEGLMRVAGPGNGWLPPYCEIIKHGSHVVHQPSVDAVIGLIGQHASRRPSQNPFLAYADAFEQHLDWIRAGGLPTYHAYAFATLRQCGAAFELGSRLLTWLDARANGEWSDPAAQFAVISKTAKSLLMKLARVASGRSSGDATTPLRKMADAWSFGFEALDCQLDRA